MDTPLDDGRAQLQDSILETSAANPIASTPDYERPHHGLLSFAQHRKLLLINAIVIITIAVFGGASYLLLGANSGQMNKSKSPSFKTSKLPVNNVRSNSLLQIGTAEQLAINGQVSVGNTLVLMPTGAPIKPTAGQIYYDQTSNTPYYYNGSRFVSLAPQAVPQNIVNNIGGGTGSITLAPGLALSGNQLGLHLQAGNGIAISGSTVTNTGVVSLSAGTSNVSITNNGNGNFSISDTIVGFISGTGTAGQLPLFNTGQSLGSSILSQSGSTITDAGALAVQGAASADSLSVTNAISGNSLAVTGLASANSLAINTNKLTVSSAGDTAIAGTLDVTGAVSLSNTLGVAGDFSVNSNKFNVTASNGNTLVAGNLTVNGTVATNTIAQTPHTNLSIGDNLGVPNGPNPNLYGLLSFTSNGITFNLPSNGSTTQTICTTDSSCASGSGGAVILGPLTGGVSSYQSDSSANSIWIYNTNVNSNLLRLEGGTVETPAFLVDDAGNTTIAGTLQTAGTLTVGIPSSTTGTLTLATGSGNHSVLLQGAANTAGSNFTAIIPTPTTPTPSITPGQSDVVCLLNLGNCVGTGGGVVVSGSVNSGDIASFSNSNTIQASNLNDSGTLLNYTGTSGIKSNTLNATNSIELNGTSINASGTLTDVAYLDRANNFSTTNTFSASGNALAVTGTPTAAGTGGLLQLGSNFSGSNANGSYLGINEPNLSTADFLNFQNNNVLELQVTSAGNLVSSGSGSFANGLTVGTAGPSGNTGVVTFNNAADNKWVKIQGSDPTASYTLTLPTTGGNNGDCLQSQGGGVLAFGSCTGGAGGGVSSLNSLTGALNVTNGGQSNQITVTPSGSSIALTLPQGIGTTSSVQFGGLTLGTASSSTGSLVFNNATNSNAVTLQSGVTTQTGLTFTLPTADGSAGQCLSTDSHGNLGFSTCLSGSGAGGGVTSLNSLVGAVSITNGGQSNQITVTPSGSSIALTLPQAIGTSSNVQFGGLTLGSALTVANGGTGVGTFTSNGLLYGNGTSGLQVTAAGTSGQLLVAGGTGTPGFVTLSGDASLLNTGALQVNKLQGTTLTLSSLSSGQILQYNGSAIVNQTVSGDVTISNTGATTIGAGKVTNTDLQNSSINFIAGTNIASLASTALGGSLTIGVVNNPSFSGLITSSLTGGTALSFTGTPAASTSSALIQAGSGFTGTSASGTYLGINQTGSADFLNFEVSAASKLRVDKFGNLTAAGSGQFSTLTVSGTPNSTNSSLEQLGATPIVSGTLGTYLGVNQSGTADFLNFQTSGASQLQVTSSGAVAEAGPLTVGTSSAGGQITMVSGGGSSNGITIKTPSNISTSGITLVLPDNTSPGGTTWAANYCLKLDSLSGTTATLGFENCIAGSSGGTGTLAIQNSDALGGGTGTEQQGATFWIQGSNITKGNVIQQGPTSAGTAVNLLQFTDNVGSVNGGKSGAICPSGAAIQLNYDTNCSSAINIGIAAGVFPGINFGDDTLLYRSTTNVLTLGAPATNQSMTIQSGPGSGSLGNALNLAAGGGYGSSQGGNLNLKVAVPNYSLLNNKFADLSGAPYTTTGPSLMASDANYIYWSYSSGGAECIARGHVSGSSNVIGTVDTCFMNIGSIGNFQLQAIASDGSFLYFIYKSPNAAVIGKAVISGSGSSTVGTITTSLVSNATLNSVDGCSFHGGWQLDVLVGATNTFLYWADNCGNAGSSNSNVIGVATISNSSGLVTGTAQFLSGVSLDPVISGSSTPTSFLGLGVDHSSNYIYWSSQVSTPSRGFIGYAQINTSNGQPITSNPTAYAYASGVVLTNNLAVSNGSLPNPDGSSYTAEFVFTGVENGNVSGLGDTFSLITFNQTTQAVTSSTNNFFNVTANAPNMLQRGPNLYLTYGNGYLYWLPPYTQASQQVIGRDQAISTANTPGNVLTVDSAFGQVHITPLLDSNAINGINGGAASEAFSVQNASGTSAILSVDSYTTAVQTQGTLQASGGFSLSSLSTPVQPTITKNGVGSGASYTYAVSAVNAAGGQTPTSTVSAATNNSTSLNGTNSNTITWVPVAGASQYYIYRCQATSATGSSALTGIIGSFSAATYYDATNTEHVATAANLAFTDTGGGLTIGSSATCGSGSTAVDSTGMLTVGTLTTANTSPYKVTISTSGTTTGGILVQNVASQSSGNAFQLQDSTGTALATIDYLGNLTVKAATINGTLTVNGHVVTGNATGGSGTTAAINGNAGSGGSPSCTVSGNDTSGQITLVTGSTSGWAAGVQCTISFNSTYSTLPHPVISTVNNTDLTTVKPYLGVVGAGPYTGFTINFITQDSSQHTFVWNYFNAQ